MTIHLIKQQLINELPRANFPGKRAESTNKTLLVYYKTAYSSAGWFATPAGSLSYATYTVVTSFGTTKSTDCLTSYGCSCKIRPTTEVFTVRVIWIKKTTITATTTVYAYCQTRYNNQRDNTERTDHRWHDLLELSLLDSINGNVTEMNQMSYE